MKTFGSTSLMGRPHPVSPARLLIVSVILATCCVPLSLFWPQKSNAREPARESDSRRRREYRSYDGTGNNPLQPLWGSAGAELLRAVPPDYADDIAEPSGSSRRSAREISNLVCSQLASRSNARKLTDMVWQWGQFLDHDIDLTVSASPTESFPIPVPTGDSYFDPFSTGEEVIPLSRSNYALGSGLSTSYPRQQVNSITAYIDGSNIYGSNEVTASNLREFTGGRMRTSTGDLLPLDNEGFFMAGDIRANEQTGLTSMHTLFVREHNRIADRLATNHSGMDDEEIFQRAREEVIGIVQAITFEEFLPALLGRKAIPPYRGYDPQVNASIVNCFSTAAYRMGHSMLNTEMLRLDSQGAVISAGNLALKDAFFNPSQIISVGIDPYLMGLCNQQAQEIDPLIVDDVRNFLFGPPGSGGFDLGALNIQRGRDHGLPDYNTFRQFIGLPRVETFADITSDPELEMALSLAYDNVDEIDPWVGFLSEDHVRGASVGPSLHVILVAQFTALRDGDRFWHARITKRHKHSQRQRQRNRLSDVIRRNTGLPNVQEDAFVMP